MLDREYDVVVVGSGGAALSAAIAAASPTADGSAGRVLVLEATASIGGTTAVSGGAMWIPMNDHLGDLIVDGRPLTDSREEALAYCLALSEGRVERELVERYVDRGHHILRWLEAHTPIAMEVQSTPDYRMEVEGAKPGGRQVEPALFDQRDRLGARTAVVRPPQFYGALQLEEVQRIYAPSLIPDRVPSDLVKQRMDAGIVAAGQALISMMVLAGDERGVTFATETRAKELVMEAGRVAGVVVADPSAKGRSTVVRTRNVVLASGGFEWNPSIQRRFLAGLITHPQTPPVGFGDGLLMAMEVGADLANMSEAWWGPATSIGETYEDQPLARQIKERNAPHSIMVNRYGQRFVNEASNYNDMGKAMFHQDATSFGMRNLPCWVICDAQYRARYSLVTTRPGEPTPDWLPERGSLRELAELVGIDGVGLEETVVRWNGMVQDGRDRDFGKGDSLFDRFMGDNTRPGHHPNLGTIEQPPFYALPVYLSCFGTKGGPRVNRDARVMHVRDRPIDGLYAAGNVMGGVAGPAYWGGGNSIGAGVIWGHLAGRHAMGVPVR